MTSAPAISKLKTDFSTFSEPAHLAAHFCDQLASHGEADEMWMLRAYSMMHSIAPAMVWLRDHEGKEINLDWINSCWLSLAATVDLICEDKHPDMPYFAKQPLLRYLSSIPHYDGSKGSHISPVSEHIHQIMGSLFLKSCAK